jgi:DNA helicase-2/ATP-dependent DNA helicase PcrA
VIAGAGSGKTDVMARRVAWWVSIREVPRGNIAAFTFTDAAADELKFRIRQFIESVTPPGENASLGGMYIGTIHGFCLRVLREMVPETYYNYEVLDEPARIALVQRGYHGLLGLSRFRQATDLGQYQAVDQFLRAYDLLNEYDLLDVDLPPEEPPSDVAEERDWIRRASLETDVGESDEGEAFGVSAARYYAYLRARRFLDFSTSQSELTRLMREDRRLARRIREQWTHIVVDEVQDINPVQDEIIRRLVGRSGLLTAVGDHRQAIYAFRGSRVDLMEQWNAELDRARDGRVIELPHNFRSTPRILRLANRWSETLSPLGTLPNPAMSRGNTRRRDYSASHVALLHFNERTEEAEWIAQTIMRMIPPGEEVGVRHDDRGGDRGLCYSDIAVLLRSSTDVRTYQETLQSNGIPAVVRAGPDLFSQPEVLLFLALFSLAADIEEFYGSPDRPGSLPWRIDQTLGSEPYPEEIIEAACATLEESGLPMGEDVDRRLLVLAEAISCRMTDGGSPPFDVEALRCREAVSWVTRRARPRRIFPQQFYHWMLEEAGVAEWDALGIRGRTVMFHLGQFSKLITSIERPGWTTSDGFRYQIIALANWGASKAKTEEAPLLVSPDAVTITTVHSAKGLQFPVVFLADVNARRFPSGYARRVDDLPFDGEVLEEIDPQLLADNENYDNERRLMYVAVTRAERYLFISHSGNQRSRFVRELSGIVEDAGGEVLQRRIDVPRNIRHRPRRLQADQRLATSFSDLRYFFECPHDFYLRKVLGFAPTIDQAFGYGRGIHNILREIHMDARRWAELAEDRQALRAEILRLIRSGLFYLRYTTGEPLQNMRRTASRSLTDYVSVYEEELGSLEFEPEREFETLIPGEDLLVSGAIDLLRLDDPPRITVIDFKSGERGDENQSGLSEELMRLQVSLYALAARQELEYEPDRGLIRYVGEQDNARREMTVGLTEDELNETRDFVIRSGREIRARNFHRAPSGVNRNRCRNCDFARICGLNNLRAARGRRRGRALRRR